MMKKEATTATANEYHVDKLPPVRLLETFRSSSIVIAMNIEQQQPELQVVVDLIDV
jgi:hypothetical protein